MRKRTLFISFLLVGFVVTGVYLFLMRPAHVEARVKQIVHSMTKADIELKVEKASLLYGFDLRKVVLKDRKTGGKIFTADRVNLDLSIPSLLIGHIGIRELGLYKPTIYLLEKNGRWNYQALTGPPAKEQPADKKAARKDDDGGSVPESISTYLPVKIYTNVNIEDLSFIYKSVGKRETTDLNMKGLHLRVAVITKTFTSIPLNAQILELLDTFIVAMNPYRPLEMGFHGRSTIAGDLRFGVVLYRGVNPDSRKPEFLTRIDLNSNKLIVRRRGRLPLPVGIVLFYDTIYDAGKDRLVIRSLDLRHRTSGNRENVWLSLKARVSNISTHGRDVLLNISHSRIALTPLRTLLTRVFGRAPRFGGTVELAPLQLSGKLDNLRLTGSIRANRAFFQEHYIRTLDAKLDASMDLHRPLTFIKRPPKYDQGRKLAWGIFRDIKIKRLRGIYNGARVFLTGRINPYSGLQARLKASNFEVGQFTAPALTGKVRGDVRYRSNLSFSNMKFGGKLALRGFRYKMGRSISRKKNLLLDVDGGLRIAGGKTSINLPFLHARLKNFANDPALALHGGAWLSFGPRGAQSYRVNLWNPRAGNEKRKQPAAPAGSPVAGVGAGRPEIRLVKGGDGVPLVGDLLPPRKDGKSGDKYREPRLNFINYAVLKPTLPGTLQDQFASFEAYLEGIVRLSLNAGYVSEKGKQIARSKADLRLPFFQDQALNLVADADISTRDKLMDVLVKRVRVTGLGGALSLNLSGKLREKIAAVQPDKKKKAVLPQVAEKRDGTGTTVVGQKSGKNGKDANKPVAKKSAGPATEFVPDLKLKLVLGGKQGIDYLRVHPGVVLRGGKVDLDVDVSRRWARGDFVVDKLSVEYRGDKCAKQLKLSVKQIRDPDCRIINIQDLSMNLPVLHDLKLKKPMSLTDGSAYYRTGGVGIRKPANLSLRFINSTHRPRMGVWEHEPQFFFLLGRGGAAARPGLMARMEYNKNVLHINWLRLSFFTPKKNKWTPSGTINGRDIFFNIADADPRKMEYGAFLRIRNLDLEPYLPRSRSGLDGIISADVNALGTRLDDPISNITAGLSVHKLSSDFSGFATRIVMPGFIAEQIVANTVKIPSIKVELKGGLVYSTIAMERGVGGILVNIEKEAIKQDRIPLAQFMARARSQARDQ